ncbi:hypothetical protein F0160_26990 [Paraburkholderia sp. JPY303]|uniref:OsmC family protein n=1 Tax=Paraburkholderia atlantica TaxID=2654982 RepID=UPI0015908A18|nr:OsmC family protein [Paraburkholderia atlantica]NUY34119.1 hypothetical protein [Paraburkholderia atlantica]
MFWPDHTALDTAAVPPASFAPTTAMPGSMRLPEARGPGGGTNPVQLFPASYAACFKGALKLIAIKNGFAHGEITVDSAGTFGRDPVDGVHMLTADIRVQLPGVERAITA